MKTRFTAEVCVVGWDVILIADGKAYFLDVDQNTRRKQGDPWTHGVYRTLLDKDEDGIGAPFDLSKAQALDVYSDPLPQDAPTMPIDLVFRTSVRPGKVTCMKLMYNVQGNSFESYVTLRCFLLVRFRHDTNCP